jgi:hypothetical protein
MRAVLAAVITCAQIPSGFRLSDLAAQVRLRAGTAAAAITARLLFMPVYSFG